MKDQSLYLPYACVVLPPVNGINMSYKVGTPGEGDSDAHKKSPRVMVQGVIGSGKDIESFRGGVEAIVSALIMEEREKVNLLLIANRLTNEGYVARVIER